jgi:transcriptional regulator with XRE-family HTH domain
VTFVMNTMILRPDILKQAKYEIYMETNKGIAKLLKEAKRDDTWLKEASWRQENKAWLERSAQIAFQVLETLSEQKRTQKDLAEAMGVSPQFVNKIVKGSENLTLETISKLEKALNLQLIEIPESSPYPYQLASNALIGTNFLPATVSVKAEAELVKEPECTSFSTYTFAA